ncbi:MAG: hypothetical protein RL174_408 [Actinomycetota bacterium]|jgi:hypothetical protein
MIKNNKKVAVAAAGLATVLTLSFAAPSFAATSTDSSSSSTTGAVKAPRVFAAAVAVPVSVTGIPTTVTTAHDAAHGARFNVYVLDAAATELPATQPTTGAVVVGVRPGTLTGTELAGSIVVRGGAAGTTTKLAVYPVNGGAGSLVTVTVAANGIATQTSSVALASTYVAPVAQVKPEKPAHDEADEVSGSVRDKANFGEGQGKKHGKKKGKGRH